MYPGFIHDLGSSYGHARMLVLESSSLSLALNTEFLLTTLPVVNFSFGADDVNVDIRLLAALRPQLGSSGQHQATNTTTNYTYTVKLLDCVLAAERTRRSPPDK